MKENSSYWLSFFNSWPSHFMLKWLGQWPLIFSSYNESYQKVLYKIALAKAPKWHLFFVLFDAWLM